MLNFAKIALTLLAGIIGYLLAKKLKAPAPAMVGSLLGVGIYNIIFDVAYMPATLKTFTQGIAGMFIGLRLSRDDLKDIKRLALPIIVLCLFFTLNTFIIGTFIAKVCGLDLLTALLSCVAGGVTDISLISMDMGAKTSIVALMHTVRLASTLLIFPSWITFFTKAKEKESPKAKDEKKRNEDNYFIKNVFSVAIAFLFGYLGSLIGIPAGSLTVAMFGIMILHWFTPLIKCDRFVKTIGQLFAGSIVGATITRATLMAIPTLLVPMLILIASFFFVDMVYAEIMSKNKILDLRTAMFAACPAGASDMALIASDLGADLAKIGLIQVLRLIYSASIMPQIIAIFMTFV